MQSSPFNPRIGTFFIMIGFGLLVLFLISGMSNQPDFIFFFIGVGAFIIGYLFRRRVQRPSSGRFDLIRRAMERSRMRREEKKK